MNVSFNFNCSSYSDWKKPLSVDDERDCEILQSILDDGHYHISPEDAIALQAVITSMRSSHDQRTCDNTESKPNTER